MSSVHSLALLLEALGPACYGFVGIADRAITKLQQRTNCGSVVFSSPAKQYKMTRWHVLVNSFTHKAIRRRMYHPYKVKERMTVKNLLVANLYVMVVIP